MEGRLADRIHSFFSVLSLCLCVSVVVCFVNQNEPQRHRDTEKAQRSREQTAVPVGEEPRHHVKFQNKYVRVIEAVIRPGDTTLFHTHAQDNVPVAIEGGKLRTQVTGAPEPTESTVESGRTTWAKAAYTHQITNIGANQVRFIDAEVLASPGLTVNASTLVNVPGHSLVFENERARAYRLILKPGESTTEHRHDGSFLTVVVTKGKIESAGPTGKGRSKEMLPGGFVWHDGPVTHTLKNVGSTRFEAVDIEWK